MHVHMPYRTVPGEGFACLLQWYNLKDAIQNMHVMQVSKKESERIGSMFKIGHLLLGIRLRVMEYNAY